MKIGKRTFLSPLFIAFGDPGVWSSESLVDLKIGQYRIRILYPSKMSGTCDTTTWYVEFRKGNIVKQLRVCWRLDVTHQHWNKESYFKKKRAQYEKKYGPLKERGT
jgi:hypothetical protein